MSWNYYAEVRCKYNNNQVCERLAQTEEKQLKYYLISSHYMKRCLYVFTVCTHGSTLTVIIQSNIIKHK